MIVMTLFMVYYSNNFMTLDQYEVKNKLGTGKYAAVYRVHNIQSTI